MDRPMAQVSQKVSAKSAEGGGCKSFLKRTGMEGGKRELLPDPSTRLSTPSPQLPFFEKMGGKRVGLALDRKSE